MHHDAPPLRILDREAVARALPPGALIAALREGFRRGGEIPRRHHHTLPPPRGGEGPPPTLLLMPAWGEAGEPVVVKVVTVFPANGEIGLPAVMGSVLLLSGATGSPLALLDGGELTARRTAAASALAADCLARPEADTLLMVGTGRMAPHLIRAHAAVRPLRRVWIWGRRSERAEAVRAQVQGVAPELRVLSADGLDAAIPEAHIVSCATLSHEPLVHGRLLAPGTHLDLVGAFTPRMREVDAEAVARASVWVDTREGALAEGGDLLLAIHEGRWDPDALAGELADLCRAGAVGRRGADEITLFKSVGTALEDRVAAELAWRTSALAARPA